MAAVLDQHVPCAFIKFCAAMGGYNSKAGVGYE